MRGSAIGDSYGDEWWGHPGGGSDPDKETGGPEPSTENPVGTFPWEGWRDTSGPREGHVRSTGGARTSRVPGKEVSRRGPRTTSVSTRVPSLLLLRPRRFSVFLPSDGWTQGLPNAVLTLSVDLQVGRGVEMRLG